MAKSKAPTTTGQRVNELIIKNKLSPEVATRQVLGNIGDQYFIPQGSTIISSGLNDLIYKDAQGYTHRIQREGDANSPNFGQTRELQTDRPAVLPLTEQIPGLSPALQAAINAVHSTLTGASLAQLSPGDESNLNTISDSERNLITQQANRTQGELLTGLYGSGTNRSTIANQAGADFSQALAIALGQQAATAAQRHIELQKFLTQMTNDTGLNLIGNLTGQETQRAGASAQVGLGQNQLNEQSNEAARNFLLEWNKFQSAQKRSVLSGALSSIASLAANVIPGLGILGNNKSQSQGTGSYPIITSFGGDE